MPLQQLQLQCHSISPAPRHRSRPVCPPAALRRSLLAAPLLLLAAPALAVEEEEEASSGAAESEAASRLAFSLARKTAARGGLPRAALAGEVEVGPNSRSPVEVGSLLVGGGWLAAFGVAGLLLRLREQPEDSAQ